MYTCNNKHSEHLAQTGMVVPNICGLLYMKELNATTDNCFSLSGHRSVQCGSWVLEAGDWVCSDGSWVWDAGSWVQDADSWVWEAGRVGYRSFAE